MLKFGGKQMETRYGFEIVRCGYDVQRLTIPRNICKYIYMCVCVCIYIYIYMYICIYIYIHVYIAAFMSVFLLRA